MLLLLLLAALSCVWAQDASGYDRANVAFASVQTEASRCSNRWCSVRLLRRLRAAYGRAVTQGKRVSKAHRTAMKNCKHNDCLNLASGLARTFCNRFIETRRAQVKFMGGLCRKNRSCVRKNDRLARRIESFVSRCVGTIPVITTTTTTTTTTAAPTTRTTAASKKSTTKKLKTVKATTAKVTVKPTSAPTTCEARLSLAWAAEFRQRSKEHRELERIHTRGSHCVTHECDARVRGELKVYSTQLRKSRVQRRKNLRKLSCTKRTTTRRSTRATRKRKTVRRTKRTTKKTTAKKTAKKTTKKATTKKTTKATTAAVVTTAPLPVGNSCLARQIRLNARLDQVLRQMNACPDAKCRENLRPESEDLTSQISDLGNCDDEELTPEVRAEVLNVGRVGVLGGRSAVAGAAAVVPATAATTKNAAVTTAATTKKAAVTTAATTKKAAVTTVATTKKAAGATTKKAGSSSATTVNLSPFPSPVPKKAPEDLDEVALLEASEALPATVNLSPFPSPIPKPATAVPDADVDDEELIKEVIDGTTTSILTTPTNPPCTSPQAWTNQVLHLHRQLSRLTRAMAECDSKSCRDAAKAAHRAAQKDLVEFHKSCPNAVLAGASNIEFGKVVNRYFHGLRQQLKRCKTVACRRAFFHKFRVDLESRHIALLRQLADQTRTKMVADVAACNGNKEFTETSKKACADLVTQQGTIRLNKLAVRELNVAKRRSLRECDFVTSPAECKVRVEAEFAAAIGKYTTTVATTAPVGRSASASVLTAGVALLISVILAVIVF